MRIKIFKVSNYIYTYRCVRIGLCLILWLNAHYWFKDSFLFFINASICIIDSTSLITKNKNDTFVHKIYEYLRQPNKTLTCRDM
jgi:hypothetical protein